MAEESSGDLATVLMGRTDILKMPQVFSSPKNCQHQERIEVMHIGGSDFLKVSLLYKLKIKTSI